MNRFNGFAAGTGNRRSVEQIRLATNTQLKQGVMDSQQATATIRVAAKLGKDDQ